MSKPQSTAKQRMAERRTAKVQRRRERQQQMRETVQRMEEARRVTGSPPPPPPFPKPTPNPRRPRQRRETAAELFPALASLPPDRPVFCMIVCAGLVRHIMQEVEAKAGAFVCVSFRDRQSRCCGYSIIVVSTILLCGDVHCQSDHLTTAGEAMHDLDAFLAIDHPSGQEMIGQWGEWVA